MFSGQKMNRVQTVQVAVAVSVACVTNGNTMMKMNEETTRVPLPFVKIPDATEYADDTRYLSEIKGKAALQRCY
jgi:hypothetical protein